MQTDLNGSPIKKLTDKSLMYALHLVIYTGKQNLFVHGSCSGRPPIRQSGLADLSFADFSSTMADREVSWTAGDWRRAASRHAVSESFPRSCQPAVAAAFIVANRKRRRRLQHPTHGSRQSQQNAASTRCQPLQQWHQQQQNLAATQKLDAVCHTVWEPQKFGFHSLRLSGGTIDP